MSMMLARRRHSGNEVRLEAASPNGDHRRVSNATPTLALRAALRS
jgi:hypothetical protein